MRCRVDPRLLDPVSAGFLDAMATILRAVFVGESEDRQERVLEVTILRFCLNNIFFLRFYLSLFLDSTHVERKIVL